MSEQAPTRRRRTPALVPPPTPADDEPALTLAAKMWLGQQAGGIAVPAAHRASSPS